MTVAEIKALTYEEQIKELKKDLKKYGLEKCVNERIDFLRNEVAIVDSYQNKVIFNMALLEIQELVKGR